MRPPEFWKADVVGRDAVPVLRMLLTPVSWGYAWAVERRFRTTTPRHAPVPVICIGNFTVGGGGKTPVTRALRAKLGAGAHTLSRGYGGTIQGPLRVTADMDAREVGDEPLLHAADGPAWIARDRAAGARAAATGGAHVILMDDGFQNPTLAKDLNIVVVDPGYGVGNGAVFPAGPLRERLVPALARADAIVLLHPANVIPEPQTWLAGYDKPILHASLEPVAPPPPGKLVAFAGLARPEKFFDTLTAAGGDVAEAVPYDDHRPYSGDDLNFLAELAADYSAQLITTEKDAARLPLEWREKVAVLKVSARFHDDAALETLLAPIRSRMS